MDRPRSLIMAAALMIAADGLAAPARSQPAQAGTPPILIQGRPLAEWVAGLADEDPARRKWAMLILARATPEEAGGEFSGLQDAVDRIMVQDRDPDVRASATRSLRRLSRSLEVWRRAVAKRDRAAVRTPLRLVDVRGLPVAGATVSTYFVKDGDRSSSFDPYESIESKTSDSKGEASLMSTADRPRGRCAVTRPGSRRWPSPPTARRWLPPAPTRP